jgi:phage terminase small subunit
MTEDQDKPAYETLKARERKFVDYIVQGDNGATAARKVAKKSRRPDVMAAKWRARTEIKKAIEERRTQAMEDAGIANAQTLIDIAAIGNFNPKNLVWQAHEQLPEGVQVGQHKKLHELDDVTARCLEHIEISMDGVVKVRHPSRLAAKRLIGQYQRLFTETHEINLGEKTLEQLAAQSWRKPEPGAA